MRILKIIALIGVILDMLFTHLGISKFGANFEANKVVRYIYLNGLWDYLALFVLAYYSIIYLFLSILEFFAKKFPQVSTIMKILSIFIVIVPFIGFGSWLIFLF